MNRRIVTIGLVAALALGLMVALILAVTGGDDDEVAGPALTTTTTAALGDTAKQLVDRLADTRKRTLHLVYRGNLTSLPEAGTLTVEIWWKGDLARQTVLAEAPQQRQEAATFVLPDGNVSCQKTQEVTWSCQRSASTATASGKPAGIIDALVSQINGKEVTVEKAKVGETDVDCYTLDKATSDLLCLRGDGIPVKFTLSGSDLLLSSAATEVDDKVFTPPAEPTPLPVAPGPPTTR